MIKFITNWVDNAMSTREGTFALTVLVPLLLFTFIILLGGLILL